MGPGPFERACEAFARDPDHYTQFSRGLFLPGSGEAHGDLPRAAPGAQNLVLSRLRDVQAEAEALRAALRPFAEAAACAQAAYDIVKDQAKALVTAGVTPLRHPQVAIAVSIAQDKVSWSDWCHARDVLNDQK